MECVSGMWGGRTAAAFFFFLKRTGDLVGAFLTAPSAEQRPGFSAVSAPRSSVVAFQSLALGGALIRSFILAASFPEGKGTDIDYLFYLEQEEVVGGWWLAAGRGWVVGHQNGVPILSGVSTS